MTEGPGSCSFTITDETAQSTAGYAIGTDGDWSITHIELDENGQPVVVIDAEGSGPDASLLEYDLEVEYTLSVGGFGGGGAGSVL